MDTPAETPNLLNDVLSPGPKRMGVAPKDDPPTADIDSSATEILHVRDAMDVPGLSADSRRVLAGQIRVYQSAVSEIGASILSRSERVAKEAQIQPAAVGNLLLFETTTASVRQAAWPITAFALLCVRETGAAIDEVLDEIEHFAETPEGRLVNIAIAQARNVQQRGQRSQKAGQKARQQAKAAGAAQTAQARQRITGKQGARQMAQDLGQGTANPPLPATAGLNKGKSRGKGKTPAK